MSGRDVFVLGTGMAPFGVHPFGVASKLVRTAAASAFEECGLSFADMDSVFVGSCHPASPRGIYMAKDMGVTGVPVQHVENASATGLAALHAAATAIRNGDCETAIVIGFDAPDYDIPMSEVLGRDGLIPPVALFAMWANRRAYENGTEPGHLAAVAAKNWNYARTNPFAARQAKEPVSIEQVLRSRVVARPLHSMMCTAWGAGAAVAVLGTAGALASSAAWSRPHIRLAASQMRSELYTPHHVFLGPIVGPSEMTSRAADAAYAEAGVAPADIDVVQVHDAFAVEELIYYELLGFAEPGEAEALVEKGAFGPGSKARHGLPEFSTDGGLIGRGHPGGPTGVAQLWETMRRLRGGDRVGMCHLLGAGSVSVVQIYERMEA